jgi:hypothetical protein
MIRHPFALGVLELESNLYVLRLAASMRRSATISILYMAGSRQSWSHRRDEELLSRSFPWQPSQGCSRRTMITKDVAHAQRLADWSFSRRRSQRRLFSQCYKHAGSMSGLRIEMPSCMAGKDVDCLTLAAMKSEVVIWGGPIFSVCTVVMMITGW